MFIEQAFRAQHEWWRYLVGILIIFLGWQLIGVIPLLVVAFLAAGSPAVFFAAAEHNFTSLGIDQNLFLVLLIISFSCGLLGLWFSVKYLHNQKFREVTTSRPKVDWNRIFFSFFLVFFANLGFFVIGYFLEPEVFEWNFQPVPFFILLVIAVLLLPLQTSFEEYFFRGYLMQGLGVLARNRWVPLLITSVGFGLMHGLNPEVEKMGSVMMVFYIGTGLILGIMTLMDEGMELALGFHAGNNILAALLVTTDWGAFQVPALFRDVSEPLVGLEVVAPVLIIYPIYLLILGRKYGWTDWKNKLFGKVSRPENTAVLEEN